ncbi:MAG: DUF3106 domain-containing protein, partial [Caldimonas sp.]
AEAEAGWDNLQSQQRAVLQPLRETWKSLDPHVRKTWLEVGARLQKRPSVDRDRAGSRMVEWARLTPKERAEVRLHFAYLRKLPPDVRKREWDAYQARHQPAASAPASTFARFASVAPGVLRVKPGATTVLVTALSGPTMSALSLESGGSAP